jgi:EmrB/QacA subfamily drug resistance transporter|eukprot:TRINITY_DN8878_c0_g1_i6.p1 TRINITY_DN8878_c0_g1~~TRINITY_DN8878_c0_g1_i6.p1  ORF type:complete len:450 (+),score=65.91 TRINITY_DN8878_c0_g1_i6:718-2067(+)
MQQIGATILSTALPAMALNLHVPVTSISGALTSYLLALAVFTPASGWISDRFGAKRIFCLALILFMFGSLLCSVAQSLNLILPARFIQGIGGALMLPIGRIILMRNVTKADMVAALSWMVMPGLLGTIFGPPIGGFITEYLNWRWIFYINIPLGLIGLTLVMLLIEDSEAQRRTSFDPVGFLLSGLCLSSLIFGLDRLSHAGQSTIAFTLVAVGLLAGYAYSRHANRRADPMLDISLLKTPTFRLATLGAGFAAAASRGQAFLMPIMLQTCFGMSAAASGAITMASAIGALGMRSITPLLMRHMTIRSSLASTGAFMALYFITCGAFRADWPTPIFFAVLLLGGLISSFQNVTYNAVAYADVTPEKVSAATSLFAALQQTAMSSAIGLSASALASVAALRGQSQPEPIDFTVAFILLALLSLGSAITSLRIDRNAGEEFRKTKAAQSDA